MPSSTSRSTPHDPHGQIPIHSEGLPPDRADGAVILLHGRGRTAKGILSIAASLAVPGMTYLAPQAAGRSWYPTSFLAPVDENQPGLSSAIRSLDTLLATLESGGIDRGRVVLVGFSQGACLAAEYIARRPARYGGVAVLIGALFGPEGSKLDYQGSLAGTPAFFSTSDPDPFVPVSRVHESAEVFRAMGARVSVHVEEGEGHAISEVGLAGAMKLIQGIRRKAPLRLRSASAFDGRAPRRPQTRGPDRPMQSPPTGL